MIVTNIVRTINIVTNIIICFIGSDLCRGLLAGVLKELTLTSMFASVASGDVMSVAKVTLCLSLVMIFIFLAMRTVRGEH